MDQLNQAAAKSAKGAKDGDRLKVFERLDQAALRKRTAELNDPTVIVGGRPVIYVPGCFVPILEFVINSAAHLPADCPTGTFILGTQGWPDTVSGLPQACIGAMLPSMQSPSPPPGTLIRPHDQGLYTAV